MIQYEYLQIYWWFLIALLGAILVFLLFVQGGQTMFLKAPSTMARTMMVNSLGRKWELTFTTLVVFGGAFFASFPLFYSTSFGGAYWLWMLILFSFIIQAISYEYRSKSGNIFKEKTYDIFLLINGVVGPVLLGTAVSMFFFGGEFTVEKANLTDPNSPVISSWVSSHGLEALLNWNNLILGIAVLFLARVQASLYFMNNINDETVFKLTKKTLLRDAILFVVFFLFFLGLLLTADGYQTIEGKTNSFEVVPFKYLNNFIELWWVSIIFIIGVLFVLAAIIKSYFSSHFTKGIWISGIGTILVVVSLFFVAGLNNTPYYPSITDPSSSLTIFNSSSSEYTLTVMSWVSVIIPFVVGYIAYAWYSMDKKKINESEMKEPGHKY